MPASYACDECGATGTSLVGWLFVSVNFLHNEVSAPNPPGGRMLDGTAPDLIFDKIECRNAWCTKAEVEIPPASPA